MSESDRREVTAHLLAWSDGDAEALSRLMPLVTRELREVAGAFLAQERAGHTLQPTALVNELYLRLVDRRKVRWESRAQFFAFAAASMRRILVDHARAHRASKRGSGIPSVPLDEAIGISQRREVSLIALDDALEALAKRSPLQSRIIELRCFGGLSLEETASVLEMSERSVSRNWTAARAWLFRELDGG
ncbi:MAG: ECF-type sigma factor [Acidobacteriota bacterium]